MREPGSVPRRIAVAAIVSAVLVLSAAGASAAIRSTAHSAGTSSSPVVFTCAGTDVSKPASFTTTCADGYTYFSKMAWSTWGGTTARAKATFWENPCTPNCAASREVSYAATVTLSKIVTVHGKRFYTKLVAIYTDDKKVKTYAFTLLTKR